MGMAIIQNHFIQLFYCSTDIFSQIFNENEVFYLRTATNILIHPKFDTSKKTVLYCHGYMETLDSESTHVIVNAYIKNGEYNILVLDWSELSNGNYFLEAIPNTKKVVYTHRLLNCI